MADYDIGKAFAEIEDELISSMIRNLERHKVEEITEGMQWSQWQAEQLKALDDYKRKAVRKYGAKFSSINDKIEENLIKSYTDGSTSQEQNILKSIRNEVSETVDPFTGSASITGEFFKTNDRKLDALVKATTDDMKRAETAVLRMANDKYRKIIFSAQVYANTGAGTYEKAVDMATKDFLSAGINCIEYKNGRRVNVKSYAEMALRTANKRAYLQGEGEMRKQWGIHTVILNKRGNPCPLCAPFVGKVIVDNVWSGGTAEEAKEKGYLLMSECIKQGLYHPNCKDSHTTYFGDILDENEEKTEQRAREPTTEEEQQLNEQLYDAEQKQQYAERQSERMGRMSKYSLDNDNKRAYGSRAEVWREKADALQNKVKSLENEIDNVSAVSEHSKPKAENPLNVVSSEILKSPEFRKQIDKLGEDTKISREMYQRTKDALQHRSGTEFEDLIFIDSLTGKSMVRNDYDVPRQCIPSKQMMKMVKNSAPHTVIAVHNHPNSSVPSLDDINNALKKKYKYGIIACHNGNLYKYKILGEYNKDIVDMTLDRLNRTIYNRNKLGEQFEIKLSQVLNELRNCNVEMEVFLWK